ncbi:MAG: AAA-associated domain-containing protein, partial [Nitrososphaerales archaeon]
MVSLPRAHVGQVIGLLEVLEDFGGRVDVAKVADDLMLNLDELLPVVEAAELLGFLKVDSGDIILTDEGKKFLAEGSSGRKKMLNQLVANLGTYKAVLHYISSHNGEVSKDDLLNFLRT